VTKDVSQFLICLCTFVTFQGFSPLPTPKEVPGRQGQAAAFYEEGTQKLVPRYDKCLNNGGEYVEK
jgi:hypothetical protein